LLADPFLTELFGAVGNGGSAGRAQGTDGFVAQKGEALGRSAGLFSVLASLVRVGDFGTPVDVDEEGRLIDELLGCLAAATARDVTRRDSDQVGAVAGLEATHSGLGAVFSRSTEAGGHSAGAEQVDFDGIVERRVKAHRGGGVDDDIGGGEHGPTGIIEAESVGADVSGDWVDSTIAHVGE